MQPHELDGTPGIEQADRDRRADLVLDGIAHRPHLHGDRRADLGKEVVDRRVLARSPETAEPDHDRERCGAVLRDVHVEQLMGMGAVGDVGFGRDGLGAAEGGACSAKTRQSVSRVVRREVGEVMRIFDLSGLMGFGVGRVP